MQAIVVVGGGGHARVVISILRKLGGFRILGYTDLKDRGTLFDAPYLGTDVALEELTSRSKDLNVVLAVGQVELGVARSALWARVQPFAVRFPFIVSPDAIVNEGVRGGEGAVVMDGAIVNSGAIVGRGTIINTHSTVEHDVVLSDWVHVAPGAILCGGVTVGEFSMIGAGATVIEGTRIGTNCVVGAGTTVVRDLNEPGVYVGNPARRIS